MEDAINTRLKSLEEQINLIIDKMCDSKELLAPFYCKSIEKYVEEYTKTANIATRMGLSPNTDIIKKAQDITDLYGKPYLSSEIKAYFADIKRIWFSSGDIKEDIKNIENILNIKYGNNLAISISKTETEWAINAGERMSKYTHMFYLLYIIIFNDERITIDRDKECVIHWAVREIFFPDEDFIDKARRFDYDEYQLSKHYGFDAITMRMNVARLISDGKLPEYSIRELAAQILDVCRKK